MHPTNHRDRMLAGLPYKPGQDGLAAAHDRNKRLLHRYNQTNPAHRAKLDRLIRTILGRTGVTLKIEPPFHCDFGQNITVGENFYANFNCVILDIGPVTIGDHVMFGPNVSLYTAGHPLHPEARAAGWEYGIAITIGHKVWLGGNVVVNPGVSIGDNTVIGSGSVVTKDLPANVVAAGNPCRVLREITDADKMYYYKDRKFSPSDF